MTDAMQILERVNAFYSGAFSQLVTFTVGVLAFVGVLVPVAIAAYQSRQLKHDQKTLTEKIESDLAATKLALREQLEKDLSAREDAIRLLLQSAKRELAEEIKKIDDLGTARSFHLQAVVHVESAPASSAADSLSAALFYAKGGDERNLRSVLSNWGDCIDKVTEEDFNVVDIDERSVAATKALETLNASGRYTADIRAIRKGIEAAKKRKASSP